MLTKVFLIKSRYLLLFTVLLFTACAQQAVATPDATAVPVATAVPEPVISIQPSEAFIDEPVSIRLSGFEPNQEVTIRATTVGTACARSGDWQLGTDV